MVKGRGRGGDLPGVAGLAGDADEGGAHDLAKAIEGLSAGSRTALRLLSCREQEGGGGVGEGGEEGGAL